MHTTGLAVGLALALPLVGCLADFAHDFSDAGGPPPDASRVDGASGDGGPRDGATTDGAQPDAQPDAAIVAVCGDGIVDSGEGCDDGNQQPGDGCDADCAVEPGWGCTGEPSQCEPLPCILIDWRPLRCTASAVAAYCGACLGGSTVHGYVCSADPDPRSSCASPTSCSGCSQYGSPGSYPCVVSVDCQ